MEVPTNLHYSAEHEWVEVQTGAPVKVGITHYAATELGDVVYVDLPSVGDTLTAGEACGEIESTKSVSELFSPVSGTVVAINEELADTPELINSDPYGGGWLIQVEPSGSDAELLDAAAYLALIGQAQ